MAVPGIHVLDRSTERIEGYYTNNSKKNVILNNVHTRNRDDHSETFDFIVSYTYVDDFENQNRIIIPDTKNGEYREFVIKHKETSEREVHVQCDAAWLDDLARNSEPLPPVDKINLSVRDAVIYALSITNYELGEIDFAGFIDLKTEEYMRPYDILMKIEELSGLQFDATITTSGNKITGRYVHMRESADLSKFTGKELVRGKDIVSINHKVDTRELVTALILTGKDAKDKDIVAKVYDDKARDRWGNNGKYSWDVVSVDGVQSVKSLEKYGASLLKKKVDSVVEYEVQAIEVNQQLGVQANFGDRIRVRDVTYFPHFYMEATVKAVQRDIFDDFSKEFTLGAIKRFSEADLRSYFNSLKSQLNNKLHDNINNITTIIETNKIHTGDAPPPDPVDGKLWYDTSISDAVVLREYKDGSWSNKTPDNVEKIGGMTKEKTLYTTLHQVYRDLSVMYVNIESQISSLLNSEYLVDETLKADLQSKLTNLNNTFAAVKTLDESMTLDTATFNQLTTMQVKIGDVRTKLNEIQPTILAVQNAINNRLALLQSQYTDENVKQIFKSVAAATGLIYNEIDNTLTGDVNLTNAEYNKIYDKLQENFTGKYVESGTYTTDQQGLVKSIDNNKSAIEQSGKLINLEVGESKLNTQLKTLYQAISAIKLLSDGIDFSASEDGLISNISLNPDAIKLKSNVIELIGDVYMQNGLVRVSDLKIGGDDRPGKIEIKNANNEVFFGLDTEQAAASELSIGTARIENIINDDIVTQSSEDMTFYVSDLGDNSNDGLTINTSFATIERALEEIPTVYNGICTIYLRNLVSGELAEVKGFLGKGQIVFAGCTSTGTPDTNRVKNIVSLKFAGNSIDCYVQFLSIETSKDVHGIHVDSSSVNASNISINGSNGSESAVYVTRNSYFEWRTGDATNVARGIQCLSGSNAYIRDINIYALDYGVVSAYASQVECNNINIKAGTATSAFSGSFINGTVTNLTTASTQAVATSASTKTVTLTNYSAGHYYHGAWGWSGTFMRNYPIQGKWSGYDMRTGYWFFGSQFDIFNGKKIKKVRVYVKRSSVNMQGITGARKFTLRMHSHTSKPSTAPNYSADNYSNVLGFGDDGWFDVTSKFANLINKTTWKGFAAVADTTSQYEYMALDPTMKVEVTYVA